MSPLVTPADDDAQAIAEMVNKFRGLGYAVPALGVEAMIAVCVRQILESVGIPAAASGAPVLEITSDGATVFITAAAGLALALGANAVPSAETITNSGQSVLIGKPMTTSAFYQTRSGLTYSANIAIPNTSANIFRIAPTDGAAFAITNPVANVGGEVIHITIRNTFGVLGVCTWGALYKLAGAWVQPANGFQRTISFVCNDAATWTELSRNAVDVPN